MFSLALLVSLSALAGPEPTPKELLAQIPKPDVRVIIDISGSMKQNDPKNLRRPALELLVQLFPEGARAGVWTFGQWVNNLVPSGPVTDSWRKNALLQAGKINSVALHTNIPEALQRALIDAELDPAYQTHFILLTDGMVDVSKDPEKNAAARQKVLDEILPRLKAAGVRVHTVALSQNADTELMERLALETGGLAAVAESAEDLTRIFLQAFDAAAPAEQVPLEGNHFLVDSSIEEFTALVFRKEGSAPAVLIGPDKKQYTRERHGADVRWFSQQNYDLITVHHPFEGEWTIQADLEPHSRVTVVSNLSLQVNRLPKGHFIGDKASISAVLKEQGKVVTRPEFLDLVDVSYEVTRRSDGKQWLKDLSDITPQPENGVFASSLTMFEQPGVYDIVVTADGKTFQRRQKQTIEVRRNFIVSSSDSDDVPAQHTVSISTKNPEIDIDSVKITATIRSTAGDSEVRPLALVSEHRWQMQFAGAEQSTHYQVELDISGKYTDGRPLQSRETVDIEHVVPGTSPQAAPEPAPEPKAAPEPEPEPKAEPEPEPKPAVPEPAPQVPAETEQGVDWGQIGLYAGLVMINVLVLALGYFVYRSVTGGVGSGVLEEEDESAAEAGGKPPAELVAAPEPEPVAESAEAPGEEEPEAEEEEIDFPDADDLGVGEEVEEHDLADGYEEDSAEEEAGDEDTPDTGEDILDLPDDAIDIDPEKP